MELVRAHIRAWRRSGFLVRSCVPSCKSHEIEDQMLVRLTSVKRLRAGWLIALVYLLCVLAPGLSFALSDGSRPAPCLTDANHELGIIHVHQFSDSTSQHFHSDGHAHQHPGERSHFSASDKSDGSALIADETPAPATDHHKSSGTKCCGMVCISALPATVLEISEPSPPKSHSASEIYRHLADNAPPRHYRPPIA